MEFLVNYQTHKLLIPYPTVVNLAILFALGLATALSARSRRTAFLDPTQTTQLKGAAVLLIIVGHLWLYVSNAQPAGVLSEQAVALLLGLSGFALTMSLQPGSLKLRGFAGKRISRLLIPYWVATFIFLLADRILLGREYSAVAILSTLAGVNLSLTLHRIDYVRGYITLQLMWYVLFFLTNRLVSESRAALLLLCSAGAMMVLRARGLFPLWTPSQLFAFPLGCLLAWQYPRIAAWASRSRNLAWSAVLLGVALVASLIRAPLNTAAIGQNVDGLLLAALLILAIGLLGRLAVVSRFLGFVGGVSYVLFLIHGPLLIKYNPVFRLLPAHLALLTFCAWLVGALFLSWLLHQALRLLSRSAERMSGRGLVCAAFVLPVLFLAVLKTDFLDRVLWRLKLRDQPPAAARLYQATKAMQLRMDGSVPDGSVLFFGDSMIQSLSVSAVIPEGVNFGIGADTTVGLLDRIDSYASAAKARAIVLAIGINDVLAGEDRRVKPNVEAILAKLPADVPVIVSALLPVDESFRPAGVNAKTQAVNRQLEDLCASIAGCRFVNCADALHDEDGNLRPEYHVGDGLHLNPKGYTIWIEQLRRTIQSLDRSP